MKTVNEAKLEFWSRSANEGFARTTAADCEEVFAAAAAKMALSDWLSMRGATCPRKFTAGDLSVEETGSDPGLLRLQALRQMSPYLKNPVFCFRGVRT